MRKLLVCSLVAVWACAVIGCSEEGAGKTNTEKKFQELYKQYSTRFYEKMTGQAETMPPIEITKEASRTWDEVFGPNKALVTKRVDEILKDLDQCPAIQEDQYNEVAVGSRDATASPDKAWKTVVTGQPVRQNPLPDEAEGLTLKQFRWSPIGDAQMALDNWLQRIMKDYDFAIRQVRAINVSPLWEVIDRNVDHPKLCLRQGPMIYIVEISRKDDYYQPDKIRWLRPKSMGPVSLPAPGAPAAGEVPPIAAPPATAPGAAPPVAPVPPAAAVPPAAPAPPPAAPAAPAEKPKG